MMENSCSLNLAQKKCIPCSGGVPALQGEELRKLAAELPAWKVIREHHIEREYAFPDFKAALDFVVRVGALAEEEGHHPDLELSWGRVGVRIFTHKIDGLTETKGEFMRLTAAEIQAHHRHVLEAYQLLVLNVR